MCARWRSGRNDGVLWQGITAQHVILTFFENLLKCVWFCLILVLFDYHCTQICKLHVCRWALVALSSNSGHQSFPECVLETKIVPSYFVFGDVVIDIGDVWKNGKTLFSIHYCHWLDEWSHNSPPPRPPPPRPPPPPPWPPKQARILTGSDSQWQSGHSHRQSRAASRHLLCRNSESVKWLRLVCFMTDWSVSLKDRCF